MKAQCMHCVDPACAAACMLHSLQKDEQTGIVSYDPTYCVGCRYCQMACPFNVPKFEFEKAVPKIVKCELCRHRVGDAKLADHDGFSRYTQGHGPACCEVCPREAVIYGKRDELLAEAKRRLVAEPRHATCRGSTARRRAAAPRCSTCRTCRSRSSACPTSGRQGVPHTAYTIQDGLYQGFVAPVALYVALGGGAAGATARPSGGGGEADEHARPSLHTPVGGPILTRSFRSSSPSPPSAPC